MTPPKSKPKRKQNPFFSTVTPRRKYTKQQDYDVVSTGIIPDQQTPEPNQPSGSIVPTTEPQQPNSPIVPIPQQPTPPSQPPDTGGGTYPQPVYTTYGLSPQRKAQMVYLTAQQQQTQQTIPTQQPVDVRRAPVLNQIDGIPIVAIYNRGEIIGYHPRLEPGFWYLPYAWDANGKPLTVTARKQRYNTKRRK